MSHDALFKVYLFRKKQSAQIMKFLKKNYRHHVLVDFETLEKHHADEYLFMNAPDQDLNEYHEECPNVPDDHLFAHFGFDDEDEKYYVALMKWTPEGEEEYEELSIVSKIEDEVLHDILMVVPRVEYSVYPG